MLGRISCTISCLALLLVAQPARSSSLAAVSSMGSPRDVVPVQQLQSPPGNDTVAELNGIFGEIG